MSSPAWPRDNLTSNLQPAGNVLRFASVRDYSRMYSQVITYSETLGIRRRLLVIGAALDLNGLVSSLLWLGFGPTIAMVAIQVFSRLCERIGESV
jgi:hypothetical protein